MSRTSPRAGSRAGLAAVAAGMAVALVVLGLFGCTTRAWYDGMRIGAENDCRRQPPGEQESCLSRVNRMSYDEYERRRNDDGGKPR